MGQEDDRDLPKALGGIGQRTEALHRAVQAVENEASVTIGLSDVVQPGRFDFTYMAELWGELQAQDMEFHWDGGSTCTWVSDISVQEAISPGSSAPVTGWASWLNGHDLLIAWQSVELEVEGWARVTGAGPTAAASDAERLDEEKLLSDPMRWLALARTIAGVIYEQEVPDAEIRRYSAYENRMSIHEERRRASDD